MGIFKKIGKGIKKVFKKIGKAIKKQFKRFGKFMNKIGIVGQIAMAFILPGIGNALMSSIGGAFTKMVGQTAAQAGASAASTAAVAVAGYSNTYFAGEKKYPINKLSRPILLLFHGPIKKLKR